MQDSVTKRHGNDTPFSPGKQQHNSALPAHFLKSLLCTLEERVAMLTFLGYSLHGIDGEMWGLTISPNGEQWYTPILQIGKTEVQKGKIPVLRHTARMQQSGG